MLLDVVCGVPQGSVLGLLLFTLYINDIADSSGLDSALFADDAALIAAEHSLKKLQKVINAEIPRLFKWLCTSKLTLNYSKTKFMLFGLDSTINKYKKVKFRININKNAISRVNEFKYRGVIIDEKLTWKNHIFHIQSKLAKVSGIIFKNRKKMPMKTMKLIYDSLAASYLSYGITAWGACPQSTLSKLQSSQNKIIRYMNFTESNSTVSNIYTQQSILTVSQTYTYEVSKFVHAISTNRNPDAFNSYFLPISHGYSTRTNENSQFVLPQPRTNFGKRSIRYNGIITWSNIPNDIKMISNVKPFKTLLRQFIIQNIDQPET